MFHLTMYMYAMHLLHYLLYTSLYSNIYCFLMNIYIVYINLKQTKTFQSRGIFVSWTMKKLKN